ncbi:DUF881 domain-containing protein [Aeromicrobium chenweiae]|uniref:DUF881 domain-containing protein n=1 Tax=Aeromicrobium chenweiae TaxID=2079793 RepID=A0A2S0WHL1_9ACTN|nr:DUF881 domain-containing protein [Aeromicrobium chenweiae]AWB90772.1 DUF881 domain-containing protein [Aeromicrobium chenweiae]TGN31033.1 DUF881 domain-containing protein [Aeromicrobium chenweiae]
MAKHGTHARQQAPLVVLLIFVITGFLFVAASVSADGTDLRPAGGDIASLLQERSQRIDARRTEATLLRSEIDDLSSSVSGSSLDKLRKRVRALEPATGLTPVRGPGVRVTLTDAPDAGDLSGVDPNWQVVHQQDIQAYVNALWAGGAEAISLQGQRLIATTGIRCVGNVVILDGVPYSPPYVIEAVGDQAGMNSAMITSPDTASYAAYAQRYNLGLDIEQLDSVGIKAYANPIALSHATVPAS